MHEKYVLALYFRTEEERRVFAEQETKFMLRTKNTRKKCYIIVFFRPFQNFAMITRHIDIERKIAQIISLTLVPESKVVEEQ